MRLHHLHVACLDKAAASSSSSPSSSISPSLTSSSAIPLSLIQCRLRPLAPKISFPESRTKKMVVLPDHQFARVRNSSRLLNCTVQVPMAGTTRWNPCPGQIKVLEMLYRSGMQSPNSFQIECITEELGKYGRIEGKNVFYWFQNHKARQRQKQKRAALLTLSTTSSPLPDQTKDIGAEKKEVSDEDAAVSCKRRCKSWGDVHGDRDASATTEVADHSTEDKDDVTLELFPLHPLGKASE